MTRARLPDLLAEAAAGGAGVGAFNVITLEHAEAAVAGAEQADAPVILQISENAVRYHRGLAPLALATLELARGAAVPVALHLDHVTDQTLVDAAIALRFSSVMFDASSLPYAENVAATADVVRRCQAAGLAVEAELGEVGGKDGVHDPAARTDPGEAARFVAATGVDALAVAVGSSHAETVRETRLDLALVGSLRRAVDVPLVLHGSSGVPDDELVRAVRAGLTKINVGTHLNVLFTAAIRERLASDPDLIDPRRYLASARDAVASEAARLLRVLRR